MNSLTSEQMHQHVPIVAWLNIVGSVLLLLIALFLIVLLPGIGAMSGSSRRSSPTCSPRSPSACRRCCAWAA